MKKKMTIRISEDLRDQLDENASLKGISTSELARTILEEYCNSGFEDDNDEIIEDNQDVKSGELFEIDYEYEYNLAKDQLELLEEEIEELSNNNKDIVDEIEFLQLVCWIYYQRSGHSLIVGKKEFEKFKATIIKINSSERIETRLKDEFNKVFADIVKVENNWLAYHRQMNFASGTFPNFNYNVLDDFIFKNNLGIRIINL